MSNLNERINEAEELLKGIKADLAKKNADSVVGVKFPLEHVGRLSTKTLFFKGDFDLGERVIIPSPSPFVRRNYGDNPIGIVVMNGNYASLIAEAEGFEVKDEAFAEDDNPFDDGTDNPFDIDDDD